MQIIDTHCHLDLLHHFPDFEELLHQAVIAGVSDMILCGVSRSTWPRMLKLASSHRELHAAPGLHPMYLNHHGNGDLDELEILSSTQGLVAIGEIGLDYFHKNSKRDEQQVLFEAQLAIASTHNLPVLLHVRKAHDQVLATLRRTKFHQGGIVHAFSGSYQQATQFIDLGFHIGICGTITYDRARKIRRVAKDLPVESLVLETDSPDIPPQSQWGKRNQPENLLEVLAHLAALRGENVEELGRQTTRNVLRILKLS